MGVYMRYISNEGFSRSEHLTNCLKLGSGAQWVSRYDDSLKIDEMDRRIHTDIFLFIYLFTTESDEVTFQHL